MTDEKHQEVEAIQKIIARYVATHPVGRNLSLIGGFRYRLLDHSVRISDDIDYHWSDDLGEKQREIIASFRRSLLSEIARLLGYSGRVDARTGPDADSPAVRTVDLTFWKDGIPNTQLEIPVEVTRIACVDPIEIRTVGGTIYATASEGDMIESKVIAILGRTILRHRDIVDVFLFQDRFRPDSAKRLKSKLFGLSINNSEIEKRICDLQENSDYHSKTIQEVIDSQLDLEAAAQLNDCGGGKIILDTVISLLSRYISLEEPNEGN